MQKPAYFTTQQKLNLTPIAAGETACKTFSNRSHTALEIYKTFCSVPSSEKDTVQLNSLKTVQYRPILRKFKKPISANDSQATIRRRQSPSINLKAKFFPNDFFPVKNNDLDTSEQFSL